MHRLPQFGATPMGYYMAFETVGPVPGEVKQARYDAREKLQQQLGLDEFGLPRFDLGQSHQTAWLLRHEQTPDEIVYRVRREPQQEASLNEQYRFEVYRDGLEHEGIRSALVSLAELLDHAVLKSVKNVIMHGVAVKKAEIDLESSDDDTPISRLGWGHSRKKDITD